MDPNDPQMAQRRAEEYERSRDTPDISAVPIRTRSSTFYETLAGQSSMMAPPPRQ